MFDRLYRSQDQAQQLEVALSENKRLKTNLDHMTVERDVLRTMLQQMLHGGQPTTETTAASSPALQEAVNAVMRSSLSPDRSRQLHAGASSPRIFLPSSGSLAVAGLRSPSSVARAHARAGNGPR